jgi:hypothetical protein
MSGEEFFINYSQNGEHYSIGPYHTRRFAMSHIDDVRRQPGVSNVYLRRTRRQMVGRQRRSLPLPTKTLPEAARGYLTFLTTDCGTQSKAGPVKGNQSSQRTFKNTQRLLIYRKGSSLHPRNLNVGSLATYVFEGEWHLLDHFRLECLTSEKWANGHDWASFFPWCTAYTLFPVH